MMVTELVEELQHSSFGARSLARACTLAQRWSETPGLRVIVTISGALSVAQQTSIVAQLITARKVHAIVTTGAVVTHSLTQEAGGRRRAVEPQESDEELAGRGLNRIFDTIESDENLDLLVGLVRRLSENGLQGRVGSSEILARVGSLVTGDGLMASAARAGVPVFVPALSDSELGMRLSDQAAGASWTFDAFQDLARYREWLLAGFDHAVLSLGGGVPRNWAQQMFAEVKAFGREQPPRLVSGLRVCPDNVALGHLSGSTCFEARSWRKIPAFDDADFVEVSSDFTIAFPFIAVAMLQNAASGR
jgi:deoxyhypusine synthase